MLDTLLLETMEFEVLCSDVLFVTEQAAVPFQITDHLDNKHHSWAKVSIDDFLEGTYEPENVGTVVLDTSEVADSLRENVCRMVRKFEQHNIATILINDHIKFPFDNFRLATILESFSFEEMLGRIENCLVYRRDFRPCKGTGEGLPCQSHLSDQLKIAGQVQRDFLPKQLPDSEQLKWSVMFQPADWVSGDIYDVQRIDENHIGFYIADGVGHSMPAALLTMFLKQKIVMRETYANDYRIFEPIEVMEKLNASMCEQNLSGCSFATVCYCLLNTATLELRFVRGGHPYPVLVRDGKPQLLESTGGLIGVFEDVELKQETVQLQRGDKLMLYSDGAEDVVGQLDDDSLFKFDDEFSEIVQEPVDEMIRQFEQASERRDLSHEEIDDVTAVGLEIL
jgi:sigma-B regulation protein RsbU (phosphoserine phosphatase)